MCPACSTRARSWSCFALLCARLRFTAASLVVRVGLRCRHGSLRSIHDHVLQGDPARPARGSGRSQDLGRRPRRAIPGVFSARSRASCLFSGYGFPLLALAGLIIVSRRRDPAATVIKAYSFAFLGLVVLRGISRGIFRDLKETRVRGPRVRHPVFGGNPGVEPSLGARTHGRRPGRHRTVDAVRVFRDMEPAGS